MLEKVFELVGNVHRTAPSFSIPALLDPDQEKAEYARIEKTYGRIASRTSGFLVEWRQEQLYRSMVSYIRKYSPAKCHYAH